MLIQTYAWANMFMRYLEFGAVGEALEMTFNGRNPCHMCKKVRAANTRQQSKDKFAPPASRAEAWLLSESSGLAHRTNLADDARFSRFHLDAGPSWIAPVPEPPPELNLLSC